MRIVIATAAAAGVMVEELRGPSRAQPLVMYRMAGIYLALRGGATLGQAGVAFGRTDHSTAIHAKNTIQYRTASGDPATLAILARIEGSLFQTERTR